MYEHLEILAYFFLAILFFLFLFLLVIIYIFRNFMITIVLSKFLYICGLICGLVYSFLKILINFFVVKPYKLYSGMPFEKKKLFISLTISALCTLYYFYVAATYFFLFLPDFNTHALILFILIFFCCLFTLWILLYCIFTYEIK